MDCDFTHFLDSVMVGQNKPPKTVSLKAIRDLGEYLPMISPAALDYMVDEPDNCHVVLVSHYKKHGPITGVVIGNGNTLYTLSGRGYRLLEYAYIAHDPIKTQSRMWEYMQIGK